MSICHVTNMTPHERPPSRRTGDTETKVYRRPGGAAAITRRSWVCVGGACELAGREVGFWGVIWLNICAHCRGRLAAWDLVRCDAPIAQATHVSSTAAALRIRADPTNTCGWCDGRHAFPPENAPGSSHRASPAGRTQVYLVRCDAPIAQATHVGSTAAALRIRADPTNTRGWCDGRHAFPPENAPGSSHRQPGLVGIIPLPLVLYQQPCIIPSQARLV